MRRSRKPQLPPSRHGVSANSVFLPPGEWPSLLAFLAQRFPAIPVQCWHRRMTEGAVVDGNGKPLAPDGPYPQNTRIYYYREVAGEIPVPFRETILYEDEHILVADKPHFLPTQPSGQYLRETLVSRLRVAQGNDRLMAMHRLDRDTAGLVLLAKTVVARDAYHGLFRQRRIDKIYEAVAPLNPDLRFPLIRTSRIGAAQDFYRRREVPGEANAETRIELVGLEGGTGLYRLYPVTGKTHQLRIHLAALGIPILNDAYYPRETARAADDFSRPLQLLARSLSFIDPFSGEARVFHSQRRLEADHTRK